MSNAWRVYLHPLAKCEVGWLYGVISRMTVYAQDPKTERFRGLHVKRAFVRLNIPYSLQTALDTQAPVLALLHIVGSVSILAGFLMIFVKQPTLASYAAFHMMSTARQ